MRDNSGLSAPGPVDTRYTQDRELSWLRFDERVMEEAWDETVPLLERLKFASIFTSNLDEFFMVRVGSICDMALVKRSHRDSKSGLTPTQQLQAILRAVRPLYRRRDKLYLTLERKLRSCNVCCLDPEELSSKERKQAERFFRDCVRPILSPQVVDLQRPFPHLPSKALNIAVTLIRNGEISFGILPVPKSLPPFLRLEGQGMRYVLTERLLLGFMDSVFDQYQVQHRCVIAVTRSADISPEDEDHELGEDYLLHMKKVLKRRARLSPVRLEIQGDAGEELTAFLRSQLGLEQNQVFRSKAPLDLSFVFDVEASLPPESAAALCYTPFEPAFPAALDPGERILPQVLRRDVLLRYPYEKMDPFLRLIREAAFDPHVLSIKITIYRLASKAKLVEYLAAAAENGKDVTVLMELRARFDERNNILYAERLEEGGCTILYGLEGFKVHAKLCSILRREHGQLQYITQVGTGNYNEKTARMYADLSLLTSHPGIGRDAAALFQDLAVSKLDGSYRYLLAAPHSLKPGLMELIDGEIAKGEQGFLFLKTNSVTDRQLIDKLAQASQAGVRVLLNVRGICCLRPGIPGLTDHITVFSIVGRFLEHARIFCFGTGEEAKLFIGSADLMTRNTQRRVEAACPILDPDIRREVLRYIQVLCRDNRKARRMNAQGEWEPVPIPAGEPVVDAQMTLLAQASQEARSAPPRSGPLRRLLSLFSDH